MVETPRRVERPAVYTIPPHRAFADALAAGILARHRDPMDLARGVVLLPTNRSVQAMTDAFVRRAEGGLLLPRLVAIGDDALDERIGAALDDDLDEPIPAAVDPMLRRMILARRIAAQRRAAGEPIAVGEAFRLAGDLARTLDQLLVEELTPARLAEAVGDELSEHWATTLALLRIVLDQWPEDLARLGRIDLADRRRRLLDRATRHWRAQPPGSFVIAAGITTAAPAVARLLRSIARLANGMVVLPALDLDMPVAEWDALAPKDPVTGQVGRAEETHPQYQLKHLLDRMGVGRGEVEVWRFGGGHDAPAVRTRVIGRAMAPALFTADWADLPNEARRLGGVRAIELATPAEEAQTIALLLREALETPGRTAALVTPDRGLARRVAAHLRRWDVVIDDSAGQPLSSTAAGTLLAGIAEAATEDFAPVALLALLKHPLVRRGDARLVWLEGVRKLDRALRGPRPVPGLDGIARHLANDEPRTRDMFREAAAWWADVRPLLAPLEAGFAAAGGSLAACLGAIREAADRLAGDAAWAGPDGREAATLLEAIETAAEEGPGEVAPRDIPALLGQAMAEAAVRPPQGGHPRLAIYGLLEARLQQADLVVLGGLNEGVWPGLPSPDPWLAPAIRRELGLPGLETRIGYAAHDFASALGAPNVVVTRARRDARAPTIASRFWLRLEALTGGMRRDEERASFVRRIDAVTATRPARRPAPSPPAATRPRTIAVTEVDRLKADPYAFYARAILKLSAWDAVDAEPSPAWRGTLVHGVLEDWMRQDDCAPDRLEPRIAAMLADTATHPLMRTLWSPRLGEAIRWIGAEMTRLIAEGRKPIAAEISGHAEIAGIKLRGKADRIDRLPDGTLAIVDYKTGKAPSPSEVEAGYAMQLGLLGLIAEQGGFADVAGMPLAFEYWSLARGSKGGLGHVSSPVAAGKTNREPADFTSRSAAVFTEAANRWLTGGDAFTAKLHPERAPYDDYDQLMRLDEWYGRGNGGD
jgi:ATP-dependent helicase/nuclease subunit B